MALIKSTVAIPIADRGYGVADDAASQGAGHSTFHNVSISRNPGAAVVRHGVVPLGTAAPAGALVALRSYRDGVVGFTSGRAETSGLPRVYYSSPVAVTDDLRGAWQDCGVMPAMPSVFRQTGHDGVSPVGVVGCANGRAVVFDYDYGAGALSAIRVVGVPRMEPLGSTPIASLVLAIPCTAGSGAPVDAYPIQQKAYYIVGTNLRSYDSVTMVEANIGAITLAAGETLEALYLHPNQKLYQLSKNNGPNRIRIRKLSLAGTVEADTGDLVVAANTGPQFGSCRGSGSSIVVTYLGATTVYMMAFNSSTLATTLAETTIYGPLGAGYSVQVAASSETQTAGEWVVASGEVYSPAGVTNRDVRVRRVTEAGVVTLAGAVRNAGMAYAMAAHAWGAPAFHVSRFMGNFTVGAPGDNAMTAIMAAVTADNGTETSMVPVGWSSHSDDGPRSGGGIDVCADAYGNPALMGVSYVSNDTGNVFAMSTDHRTGWATDTESGTIGGAVLTRFDGSSITEIGNPSGMSLHSSLVQAAAGSASAGVYAAAVSLRWTTTTGEDERTDPVSVGTYTLIANDRVRLRVSSAWTMREATQTHSPRSQRRLRLELWQTVAGGTTYYLSNPGAAGTYNDPSAAYNEVFLSDGGVTDAILLTRPIMHTTGGKLATDPPAGGSALCATSAGRMITSDPDAAGFVFRHHQREAGQSAGLSVYKREHTGLDLVTGLARLGDRVLAVGPSGCALSSGEGYNEFGQQDDASPWVRVSSAVSGFRARDVCVCRGSVYVLDTRRETVWQIGSDGAVTDIGRKHGPYTFADGAGAEEIDGDETSGTVRVRFSSSGSVQVYDVLSQSWATHSYAGLVVSAIGAAAGVPVVVLPVGASADKGAYIEERYDGTRVDELLGSGGSSTAIPATIRTRWIRLAQWDAVRLYELRVFCAQRTRGNAADLTGMTITWSLKYDGSEYEGDTGSITGAEIMTARQSVALLGPMVIRPRRQVCTSFSLEILTSGKPNGGYFGVSEIAAVVGAKGKPSSMPVAKRDT